MSDARICEEGGQGIFLGTGEELSEWNGYVRAAGYLAFLFWCFLGVSIVADIFMAAIEAVTSRRKMVKLSGGRQIAVMVWNPTVANLTLMALGSSAPEILLSVLEIFSGDFHSGELGPSTIVGSAAFNLLVIIAVCVYVIPDGQKRTIKQPVVFAITACWSVFAYLWLVIILSAWTPDVVSVEEGILTFLFFPILVVMAYLADIGKFDCLTGSSKDEADQLDIQALRDKLAESGNTEEMTEKDLKMLVAESHTKSKTRAAHRLEASPIYNPVQQKNWVVPEQELSVGFLSPLYYYTEGSDHCSLEVMKYGKAARTSRVLLKFVVSDDKGMVEMRQLEIPASAASGKVQISIPPQLSAPEGAKNSFRVDILEATFIKDKPRGSQSQVDVQNDCKKSNMRVHISDDSFRARVLLKSGEEQHSSGQLRFEVGSLRHNASAAQTTTARVKVIRFNGAKGEISCLFKTEPDTARPVFDYEHVEGVITFREDMMEQVIEVPVTPKSEYEGTDKFFMILEDTGGACVVVEDGSKCGVTILETGVDGNKLAKAARLLDTAVNLDAVAEGNVEYRAQFMAAFQPVAGGGQEVEEASAVDWVLHFVSLPWKVWFAFIPPITYCGGWLCFFVALAFIGLVTALIGDAASLFGCCMGMPDSITAITVVALGTSLPDCFASKVAAVEDATADNAIGNVTGSNSVNVFLGLGMPWAIAAIYWNIEGATPDWKERYPDVFANNPDGGFVVKAGDLVFSVLVFTLCSLTCLATIMFRRKAFQAELGGPAGVKTFTAVFFVTLWIYYIALASWKSMNPDAKTGAQVVLVVGGIVALGVALTVIILLIKGYTAWTASRETEEREWMKEIIKAKTLAFDARMQSGVLDGETFAGVPSMQQSMQMVSDGQKMVPIQSNACSNADLVNALRAHILGLNNLAAQLDVAAEATAGNGSSKSPRMSNKPSLTPPPANVESTKITVEAGAKEDKKAMAKE